MATVTELIAALLAFSAEAPKLPRDKTATVNTQKGSYSYGYTSLDTIADQIQPLLTKHGLAWTAMPTVLPDGSPGLAYRLMHSSGESLAGEMPLLVPDDAGPQQLGSAITYARRYAKVAVLDLVAEDDDDGQAAQSTYHRESRANGGVDMREHAKGLTNDAINLARQHIGLPRLEKPWASLVNIPTDRAEAFSDALKAAKAAQG